jgi:hypothetical protein
MIRLLLLNDCYIYLIQHIKIVFIFFGKKEKKNGNHFHAVVVIYNIQTPSQWVSSVMRIKKYR